METGKIYFIDWDKYQDEYLSSIYRKSNWTLNEFNQINLKPCDLDPILQQNIDYKIVSCKLLEIEV